MKNFSRAGNILAAVAIVLIYGGGATMPAVAMSSNQRGTYQLGIHLYDSDIMSGDYCSGSGGDTTLVGNDNTQKAWNYLRSAGLDDVHTAAIIGNFMQESHLDPTAIQNGGNSKDPTDAGELGWGVSQWTPGARIIDIAKQQRVDTPVYLLSSQLNIIWGEMNSTSPTGYQHLVDAFKKVNGLDAATEFFRKNYEGGTNPNNIRQKYAADALSKYGGGADGGGPVESGGLTNTCGSSNASVNCRAAEGSAKILCAAKVYDTVSYEESIRGGHQGGAAWHASCPTIGPSCVLDCSGLVNIAVYDAYNIDLRQNTYSEADDTTHWKHISVDSLQPGDLIQPNPGHVEIVDHINNNTIYTFGAHSPHRAQKDQVGPSQYSKSEVNLALHWIGT